MLLYGKGFNMMLLKQSTFFLTTYFYFIFLLWNFGRIYCILTSSNIDQIKKSLKKMLERKLIGCDICGKRAFLCGLSSYPFSTFTPRPILLKLLVSLIDPS